MNKVNMRITALARKEFLHVIRDSRSLYLALALPLVFLFLFGYAISLDVDHVKMAVCDQDQSAQSRELLETFTSSGYFRIIARTSRPDDLNVFLDRSDCRIGLLIPPGFAKAVKRMESPQIQILIDGTETNTANIVAGYVQGIGYVFSSRLRTGTLNRIGLQFSGPAGVETATRFLYNPELRSRNFIVPGLIAVIMAIIMTILSALAIVREQEKGTMEQLIVTPVRPWELMLGKMAPYWVIGLVDMLLIVLAGTFVFNVPLKGNLVFLFLVTGIFAFANLGIGLLISTFADSQQLATQLALVLGMLPNFILSGFMFPVGSMPLVLRLITCIIPSKYFMIVLRGIFLKGTGFFVLTAETATLTVFGLVLVGLASMRFRKKLV